MRDRVPTYPNRVKLTPVSGQSGVYDMERADSPTQEGTPLNRATLLSQDVQQSLGLGDDATPNQALQVLHEKKASLSDRTMVGDIYAETFAGQVAANGVGQSPSSSLLRNSKLVSVETTPTVNGEICWQYE